MTIYNIIEQKIKRTQEEIDTIINETGFEKLKIGAVSFLYECSAPTDFLSPEEKKQQIHFITKYENLPELNNLKILKNENGFILGNMANLRHILCEYRPIVSNQRDSIFYRNIQSFCHKKLSNKDHSSGLSIRVLDSNEMDITTSFQENLVLRIRIIAKIIKKSDFDYIYNGILQHSDHKYTLQFLKDYESGNINYIFLKNVALLDFIKKCLDPPYQMMIALTYPKLGYL